MDSTASHHMALTAESELLTWNSRRAPARDEISGAVRPQPPLVTNRSAGIHAWRPAGSEHYACCCTSLSAFDCNTGCAVAGYPDEPIVQRVLAYKPGVADVACGQEHTLALLETGQVREPPRVGGAIFRHGPLHKFMNSCGLSPDI